MTADYDHEYLSVLQRELTAEGCLSAAPCPAITGANKSFISKGGSGMCMAISITGT